MTSGGAGNVAPGFPQRICHRRPSASTVRIGGRACVATARRTAFAFVAKGVAARGMATTLGAPFGGAPVAGASMSFLRSVMLIGPSLLM